MTYEQCVVTLLICVPLIAGIALTIIGYHKRQDRIRRRPRLVDENFRHLSRTEHCVAGKNDDL